MDDLQYSIAFLTSAKFLGLSFKPCYKWMTFNTLVVIEDNGRGIPRFKPCYKWMTFNTKT